jgi:hypothetical protein
MQHQQPQALQTDGESLRRHLQQHLPQQEIQKTCLSVQAPCSSNNNPSKVATAVQQVATELCETVSEKDKIMIIIKMALN